MRKIILFVLCFQDVNLRCLKVYPCMYRKQCVQAFNVFDFLKDIVSKVPDLGGSEAAGEDCSVAKRRFGKM